MRYPSDPRLSLAEWLVLGIVCEQPTYGRAVAGLLSRDGRLGRIWHVSRPMIYRAVVRLERLGLVQVSGRQPASQDPDGLLVTATQPGLRAARWWLHEPVVHDRDVRPELMLKLALHDWAGGDPRELLREQRAEFGSLATALASQLEVTTGIEHTLALWRHQTISAAMQFLDGLTQQAKPSAAARTTSDHQSRQRPAFGPG